jgi:GNAT superfamily N-acetyltransferase
MAHIRGYRSVDAPAVGVLIADTYSQFNLNELSEQDRDRFLGPFRFARSSERLHQDEIARVLEAAMALVAEDAGEIVGVLRGRPERLQSLFVRGDHHRQGIGQQLVEHFERECVRQDSHIVRLAATVYAVPFYLAMGYRRTTGLRTLTSFDGRGLQYQPMKKTLRGPARQTNEASHEADVLTAAIDDSGRPGAI